MNGRDNAKLEQRRLKSYYIRIVTEIPKTGGFSKPNGIRRRHNCFNSFFLLVAVNLKYAGPGKHLWGKPGCSLVLARTDAHRFYFLPLKEAIQLFAVIFSFVVISRLSTPVLPPMIVLYNHNPFRTEGLVNTFLRPPNQVFVFVPYLTYLFVFYNLPVQIVNPLVRK